MRNIYVFFMTYATLIFSTVTGLSFIGEFEIDVYMALYVVEFFVASELASPFDHEENRRRNIVGIAMLVIFVTIIVKRMVEILM